MNLDTADDLRARLDALIAHGAESATLPEGFRFITEHRRTAFSEDGRGPAYIMHIGPGEWEAGITTRYGVRVSGPKASTPHDAIDGLRSELLRIVESLP